MFLELRGELAKRGHTFKSMCKAVGLAYSSVCKCLILDADWRLSDMYKVLNWLALPHSELNRIFPEGGK